MSPGHLIRLVSTSSVVSKKLHIPLPTHLHESLRLPLCIRRLFFALSIRNTIDRNLLRYAVLCDVMLLPLAVWVFLEDLDWHRIVLILDDFADLDVINATQKRAFTGDFALGEVKLVHGASETICAVGDLEAAVRDPEMLEALVDSDPFVNLDSEHAVNKVESRVTNAVPVWRWIIEAPHFDLLGEVVGVVRGIEFVGEGREAAKTDIQDNSQRPYVNSTGVFPMSAVFQDFWCNI